jgi:hypothetical protein
MAGDPDPKSLEALDLRLTRIESAIEKLGAAREPVAAAQLSAEEIAAYRKVRDVIAADYGEFCGINDCFRCIVVRCVTSCITNCVTVCVRPCDIECTCGPCNLGGGFTGGLSRFGRLGGG